MKIKQKEYGKYALTERQMNLYIELHAAAKLLVLLEKRLCMTKGTKLDKLSPN